MKTVCDASPAIRKQMSDTCPAVTVTDNIDTVLNDTDIQGVVIGIQGMMVFDDTQPVEAKLTHYPNQISWKDGIPVSEKAEGNAIDLRDAWEEPLLF